MKVAFAARRYANVLTPVGEDAREKFASIPNNAEVIIEVRTARSVKQLRLFWGLMGLLADNCDQFTSKDDAADQIKIDVGAIDWKVHQRTGMKFGVPQSIAFESMPQHKFNRFMERVFYVVEQNYLPGASEDFRRELYALVDGPEAIGERAA